MRDLPQNPNPKPIFTAFARVRIAGLAAAILLFGTPALADKDSATGNPPPSGPWPWKQACRQGIPPVFEDYPVEVRRKRKGVALRSGDDFTRKFPTRLRASLRDEPVNFAGRYVLTSIGCGPGCIAGVIIDGLSGRASQLPFVLLLRGHEEEPLQHHPDSRLLIVQGRITSVDESTTKRYIVYRENAWVQICAIPVRSD